MIQKGVYSVAPRATVHPPVFLSRQLKGKQGERGLYIIREKQTKKKKKHTHTENSEAEKALQLQTER